MYVWQNFKWQTLTFYSFFTFILIFLVSNSCSLTMQFPLTSMASKTEGRSILKITINQCKFSKVYWEIWIIGRDRNKTKCPQQWGVFKYTYNTCCISIQELKNSSLINRILNKSDTFWKSTFYQTWCCLWSFHFQYIKCVWMYDCPVLR